MVQVLEKTDVQHSVGIARDLLPATRPPGPALTIEIIPAAGMGEDFLPHWRGLADRALEANPFMSPEFIRPAAAHLMPRGQLLLAAVWRSHPRSRELTGLFALKREPTHGFRWFQPPRLVQWTHPLMPVGIPLLSRDPEVARQTLNAFLSDQLLMRQRISLASVPVGSAFDRTLEQVATVRGLSAQLTVDAPHSRGLNIDLDQEPATEAVHVAQEPATLRIMLEQALAMDATAPRQTGESPPLIHDAGRLALMRSVVRGFAQTRQIFMAKINDEGRKAAAIAIVGVDKAYLWQLFGPSAHDPRAETALACALRAAIGKPLLAAAAHPIAGFCTVPLRTRTVSLGQA